MIEPIPPIAATAVGCHHRGQEAGVVEATASDARPIASFTHDMGGEATLHAYYPEPAEVTRQGEQMANQLYGIIDTKSPSMRR